VKEVIVLNKRQGETPLECMDRFRMRNKKYKSTKMTYAGRLDPVASGLLLVLVGEGVHKKEKYLKLNKEYRFEVLFGVSTDTYDILGKVLEFSNLSFSRLDLIQKIKKNLKFFRGRFIQKYPIYSSKTVKGKNLFQYARNGDVVEVPERVVEVKSLRLLGLRKIYTVGLLKNIQKNLVTNIMSCVMETPKVIWGVLLALRNKKTIILLSKEESR
jgi:tRNA pseudouridine55 synthase